MSGPVMSYTYSHPLDTVDGDDVMDMDIGSGLNKEGKKAVNFSDVFSDRKEIDPGTVDEKFVPDWDLKNKDLVMDTLSAKDFMLSVSTPLDHFRSRHMKSRELGSVVLSAHAQSNVYVAELYHRWVEAEFVKENLE